MNRPVKTVPGAGASARRVSATTSIFSAPIFGPIPLGITACVLAAAGYGSWWLFAGAGATATLDELRTASMCAKVNLTDRFQFRATGLITHKDVVTAEGQCAFVAGSESLQQQLDALGQPQAGVLPGTDTTPEPVEPHKAKN